MRSITIVPLEVPVDNEPTACKLIIGNDDYTTTEYSIVLPKNMLTVISNPPDLSNFITTIKAETLVNDLDTKVGRALLSIKQTIADLPRVTDTSNFIKYDDLTFESEARKSDVKIVTNAIDDIDDKLESVEESIADTNKSINDNVSKFTELAKTYKDQLDQIETIKDNSISGLKSSEDGLDIKSITSSKEKTLTVTLEDDTDLNLVSEDNLTDSLKELNEDLTKSIKDLDTSLNKRIDDLSDAITAGNKLLTDVLKAFLIEGVK